MTNGAVFQPLRAAPPMKGAAQAAAGRSNPIVLAGRVVFTPLRAGARLAGVSWRRTLAMHVLMSALATLVVALADSLFYTPNPGPWQIKIVRTDGTLGPPELPPALDGPLDPPRRIVAGVVSTLYLRSAPLGDVLAFPGLVLAVAAVAVVLGLCAVPWVAVRETTGGLVARCVKLGLWSNAILPFGAVLWLVVGFAWITARPKLNGDEFEMLLVSLAALVMAWWFAIVLRLGRGGAPRPTAASATAPLALASDGLIAAPSDSGEPLAVPPRCVRCDYLLVGLPLAGQCPECGQPIAATLAALAEREAIGGSPVSRWHWLRVMWRVMRRPQMLADTALVVRAADVRLGVSLVLSLLAAIPAPLAALALTLDALEARGGGNGGNWLLVACVPLAIFAGIRAAGMLLISVAALLVGLRPRRDIRRYTALCVLASAAAIPPAVAGFVLVVALGEGLGAAFWYWADQTAIVGRFTFGDLLVTARAMAGGLIVVWFGARVVCAVLRLRSA
ncbi:MAG: hypothetical protein CHACPFDD_03380 [Phycisphaerae bacterium]|nr:hypothetical protein [Phycisphaerae bacterium]